MMTTVLAVFSLLQEEMEVQQAALENCGLDLQQPAEMLRDASIAIRATFGIALNFVDLASAAKVS